MQVSDQSVTMTIEAILCSAQQHVDNSADLEETVLFINFLFLFLFLVRWPGNAWASPQKTRPQIKGGRRTDGWASHSTV